MFDIEIVFDSSRSPLHFFASLDTSEVQSNQMTSVGSTKHDVLQIGYGKTILEKYRFQLHQGKHYEEQPAHFCQGYRNLVRPKFYVLSCLPLGSVQCCAGVGL